MNSTASLALVASSSSEQLAAFLKAAGDQLRLDILRVLRNDSFGVLELAQLSEEREARISQPLTVLASAGLVSTRRDGNSILYRRSLADAGPALVLHEQLLGVQVALPLEDRVQEVIAV